MIINENFKPTGESQISKQNDRFVNPIYSNFSKLSAKFSTMTAQGLGKNIDPMVAGPKDSPHESSTSIPFAKDESICIGLQDEKNLTT